MNCHACGAQLAGTARFCHKCGAQVGGAPPQAAGWRGGLPWGVAGIAVGALLTVLVLRLGAGSREPGAGAPASAPAPGSLLPAPGISQMSPEERAIRAYRDFLRNEKGERAKQRPEYAEHGQNLDAFHEQATEVTSGKTSGAPRQGR